MSRSVSLFVLILFFAAGTAQAFLPSDASEREPEIRAHRQKVRKEYDELIEERREHTLREHARATAAIGVPPWELERRSDEGRAKKIQVEQDESLTAQKRIRSRILVSIVLFIIIGLAVGFVKHATREVDA